MIWESTSSFFPWLILAYFLSINGFYSFLTLTAFFEVRKQRLRAQIEDYSFLHHSRLTPGLSLLVPAYNEEATIVETVRSLMRVRYPRYEIIVINDGSTDGTMAKLKDSFTLRPTRRVMQTRIKTKKVRGVYVSDIFENLIVIDKTNGKKADTLNAGINAARHPYFIALDADVILQDDALLRLMRPMLEDPTRNVAAGGIVRVINDSDIEDGALREIRFPRKTIARFQVLEYIRAFTAGRAGYAWLDSLMIISGAFGVFNTRQVRRLGGYERHTVGEDMELLMRLHHHLRRIGKSYRVLYRAYPVCLTEVPETVRVLARQRNRWHRGLCDVLWRHREMLLNPRFGIIGLFGMPTYFFFEFIGPFVESFGYAYAVYLAVSGRGDWIFWGLFLSLAILWGMLLSLTAVLFEELNFRWYTKWRHIALLLFLSFLENLGYRQMTVLWRISGFIDFLRGKREWGAMPRRGFGFAAVNR